MYYYPTKYMYKLRMCKVGLSEVLSCPLVKKLVEKYISENIFLDSTIYTF